MDTLAYEAAFEIIATVPIASAHDQSLSEKPSTKSVMSQVKTTAWITAVMRKLYSLSDDTPMPRIPQLTTEHARHPVSTFTCFISALPVPSVA